MKKSLKIAVVPLTAFSLLLGGCSHSYSKNDVIIQSKAGDVKTDDVMKDIGNDQISKSAYQLILNKVLEKEYHKKVSSNDIDKDIQKQKDMFTSNKQFKDALKQQGLTEDKLRDQIKMQKYQKELLDDTVKISDKKAKEDSMKVSHILIEAPKDDNKDKDKAKNKAEDIKKQLDNGADFDKLAKENSDDTQSKDNDGLLGYIPKGLMDKSFEKAAFKLKPGQISDVVKTDYGYHIIKADKESDFDKEKSNIKQQLIQQKIQEDPSLLTDAYKKLLDKYDVKYKDKDVEKYIKNNFLNGDKLKNQLGQNQQPQAQ